MSEQTAMSLRVLFLKRSYFWVAQCLEYDIVAQGKTLTDAQEAFERVFVSNIIVNLEAGVVPLSQFREAPREFFDLYERSQQLVPGNNIFNNFTDLPTNLQIPAYQIPERRVCG